VGGNDSCSMSTHEDLDERDRVLELLQGRIQAELLTTFAPAGPVRFGGGGSRRNDAGGDVRLHKAEITAELSCCFGVHVAQGVGCGQVELKCVGESKVDRWTRREASSAIEFCLPGGQSFRLRQRWWRW
jgi:hypothetical protein